MKWLERKTREARAAKAPAAPVQRDAPKAEPAAIKATPYARKLAVEMGLDLASIQGTGADGLITLEDVRKAGGMQG